MFEIGANNQKVEGTGDSPLTLADSAKVWELLLGAIYREYVRSHDLIHPIEL